MKPKKHYYIENIEHEQLKNDSMLHTKTFLTAILSPSTNQDKQHNALHVITTNRRTDEIGYMKPVTNGELKIIDNNVEEE